MTVNNSPDTPRLVQDFLEASATRLPAKVALICDNQRLTYAEIDERANRLAQALRHHGVQPGDRVVIWLKNCVEVVTGIFATLKAGGTFVVVNYSTKEDKLAYILNNCHASAILLDGGMAERGTGAILLQQVPSLKFLVGCGEKAARRSQWLVFDDLLKDFPATRLPRLGSESDLACLIYTSGSTGDPKGVMSEHRNVVFATGSIISYLQNVESDIVINVLPLSFDYGLYQLLMVFRFGGTLVLATSFAFPAVILKLMEQERVTGFPGVPTIFTLLLQMDMSPYDLSRLRYLTNTAAALPPSHIQELRKKFHWTTLFSMYGLTETKRTLYLPPAELDRHPGSVGIPIPGTECWVEDAAGRRCAPGEVGELVVSGGHVMRGYWEAPEATARRFRTDPVTGARHCHTGDLFRQDAEGFFYFVGRSDDIIKSRGEKVAPKEVENVLYALKGVHEAAVVGVADPVLGQAIKAIIVPVEGVTLTTPQVLAHCRAHLEDFMVPQQVEFRTELPKTSSGKITKKDLH
jgi:long-chain acyl-CoA synthetase